LRELSPILFGAVHHVYSRYFDIDELFRCLVEVEGSSASMHRAFDEDVRKQRTFVFNLEYYTASRQDPSIQANAKLSARSSTKIAGL
jgi:hypothetical protein